MADVLTLGLHTMDGLVVLVGPGVGLVIERSRVRLPAGALPGSLGIYSAFHLSGVGKSSTSLLAGVKAGRVHLCRVAGNTM